MMLQELWFDLVWAAVNKFASGSIVSCMVRETPVWLKSGRHIKSFLVSFVCMQLWPFDLLHRWIITHKIATETILYGACALYKLRKIAFAMVHPAFTDEQWHLKVLLSAISVEFGSILRLLTGWKFKGTFTASAKAAAAPENFTANAKWAVHKFSPGVVAILLVGIGQRCWLCPGVSSTDAGGFGWSPLPPKTLDADLASHGVPEPFRPRHDPKVETAYHIWTLAIEYLMHPVALLLLLYRYWRQVDYGYTLSWSIALKSTAALSSAGADTGDNAGVIAGVGPGVGPGTGANVGAGVANSKKDDGDDATPTDTQQEQEQEEEDEPGALVSGHGIPLPLTPGARGLLRYRSSTF